MEAATHKELNYHELTDVQELHELKRRNHDIDTLCEQASASQDYETLRDLHTEMVANRIRIAALEDHIFRN